MTIEDCKKHDKRIEEYVNKCFAGMSKNMDEYSKVKYLYDYIIENTEYDITADNDQNLLSVFEDGRSVCQGYSSAMQYLMLKQGMFCTTIRGVANNEGHAWNIVRIDGDYYHLDVTWGDASYSIANEGGFESLPSLPEVSYEFFCVPTSEIEKTHRINNDFEIPSCVAKKANYFYREGLMFEAVDTEKLKRMFEAGYSNGDESVLIKCADENVYADMKDYLITESKIFDYLQAKNVNYVSLDNFNEMIFYLSQSEVSEADETVNE